MRDWNENTVIAFDFETSGKAPEYRLEPWRVETGDAWITSLAYGMRYDGEMRMAGGLDPTVEAMREMLTIAISNDYWLLGHNVGFDIGWLVAYGLEDLVLQAKFLDSKLIWKHAANVPSYAEQETGYGLKDGVRLLWPDEAGYEENIDFDDPSEDARARLHAYNEKDVEFTLRLAKHWFEQLNDKQRQAMFIEAQSLPLMAIAHVKGLPINVAAIEPLKAALVEKEAKQIEELAKIGVSPDVAASPKKLADLLYKVWGLPQQTGKTGRLTTDKNALHELALIDDRVALIDDLRSSMKDLSSTLAQVEKCIAHNGSPVTHPEPIVFRTYTGRVQYSSTTTGQRPTKQKGKPDGTMVEVKHQTGIGMQQIKKDPAIRNLICAPEGHMLVEFDAAAQEFRWLAVVAQEPTMMRLCHAGEDPHSYMGAAITGMDYREMMAGVAAGDKAALEGRKLGKLANLSLGYRTSAKTLRQRARTDWGLPMTLEQAQQIHASYQKAYPKVVDYWARQRDLCEQDKGATTIAGRRVNMRSGWGGDDEWKLHSTTINFPVQGCGADQKYLALACVRKHMDAHRARLALDLHDGLYFCVPTESVQAFVRDVRRTLDNLPYESEWGFTPPVPLTWDCKVGMTFGAMKDYREDIEAGGGTGADSGTTPVGAPRPSIADLQPVVGERNEGEQQIVPEDIQPDPDPGQADSATITSDLADDVIHVDFRASNQIALDVALKLASAGVSIFPANKDKHPVRGFRWNRDHSKDPDEIRRWFESDPEAVMVGMPCGENNLVAIDPDRPKPSARRFADGVALFEELLAHLNVDLPGTPVIVSPSGGRHYIFSQPETGARFGCSKGTLPDSVDVKGAGGYLIATGSRRVDGESYRALPGTPDFVEAFAAHAIPELPFELAEIIRSRHVADVVKKDRFPEPATPIQLIEEALLPYSGIANDAAFDDRNDWVHMAHAIFGATHGSREGREAWLAWSNRRKQKAGEPERVWDTIRPEHCRAGVGFIKERLRDRGRDDLLAKFIAAEFDDYRLDAADAAAADDAETEDPEADDTDLWMDGDQTPGPVPTIVEDLIPAQGLTFLGGQSGAGKTFVAIQLCVALGSHTKFFGRETEEKLGAIYVAAEGRATIAPRLKAAKLGGFVDEDLPVVVIGAVPDLTDKAQRRQFIQSKIKKAERMIMRRHGVRTGVVIVDTLAKAFSMKDENSAAEMNAVCRHAEALGEAIGAATLVIHHYGKDASTGLRGSSALRGAGESVIAALVTREGGDTGDVTGRWLEHVKSRVGEEGAKWAFTLRSVDLGMDAKGKPHRVAHIVVEGDLKKARGPREKVDKECILSAMACNPTGGVQDWADVVGCDRKTLRLHLIDLLTEGKVTKKGSKWVAVSKQGNVKQNQ
jgi:DNA polymerase I-like protein with 3'-5' exonuclease and polymerase domains